jgi:DeoR family fructose operon transcriptional repressor
MHQPARQLGQHLQVLVVARFRHQDKEQNRDRLPVHRLPVDRTFEPPVQQRRLPDGRRLAVRDGDAMAKPSGTLLLSFEHGGDHLVHVRHPPQALRLLDEVRNGLLLRLRRNIEKYLIFIEQLGVLLSHAMLQHSACDRFHFFVDILYRTPYNERNQSYLSIYVHVRAYSRDQFDRNRAVAERGRIGNALGGAGVFADERKMHILAQLREHHSVSVAELARTFQLSESTIRRDLQDLEQQGYLKRTHGGAVSIEVAAFEPSIQEKTVQNQDEKYAIARMAQQFIQPGDTVLLDAGTTTLQIARQCAAANVTFVTNSLPIADELSTREGVHLILLGGELRPNTGAMVGPFCEQMLGRLHVDTLFLGANGIDPKQGVTTPNVVEAATKAAMIRAARRVVLVADHSKFKQISLVKVCDLADLDVLITDGWVPEDLRAALDKQAVQIFTGESSA